MIFQSQAEKDIYDCELEGLRGCGSLSWAKEQAERAAHLERQKCSGEFQAGTLRRVGTRGQNRRGRAVLTNGPELLAAIDAERLRRFGGGALDWNCFFRDDWAVKGKAFVACALSRLCGQRRAAAAIGISTSVVNNWATRNICAREAQLEAKRFAVTLKAEWFEGERESEAA